MKNKKIKQMLCILLAVIFMIGTGVSQSTTAEAAEYWPEGTDITAEAAIVMELNTGTVLYEKNADTAEYPASITKILTALIAIENSDMDEVVTFSHDSVYETEGSGIARDVGEEMTMEQCLYGMMLASANECAYAIAEHVGGDITSFVQMMNEKAQELGCTNTHFNNPHGLPDDNHYTTAHDMALIAQAAYANETLRIIMGTKTYTIPVTNKHPDEETLLQNHHQMLYPLKTTEYLYDYCVGGKTGYTTVAGSTLVTFAEKDGMTLVCVILKDEGTEHYVDTTNLFNYCFENFQNCNVSDNESAVASDTSGSVGVTGTTEQFAKIDADAMVTLPKTAEFSEAQSEVNYDDASDTVIGTIDYTFAGHSVGSADIVVSENDSEVEGFEFGTSVSGESEEVSTAKKSSTMEINLRKILVFLFAILIVVLLILLCIYLGSKVHIIRHKMSRNNGPKYKKIRTPRKRRRRR